MARCYSRGDAHNKEANTGNYEADEERNEELQQWSQAELPGSHRALLSLVQLIFDDVIVKCLMLLAEGMWSMPRAQHK